MSKKFPQSLFLFPGIVQDSNLRDWLRPPEHRRRRRRGPPASAVRYRGRSFPAIGEENSGGQWWRPCGRRYYALSHRSPSPELPSCLVPVMAPRAPIYLLFMLRESCMVSIKNKKRRSCFVHWKLIHICVDILIWSIWVCTNGCSFGDWFVVRFFVFICCEVLVFGGMPRLIVVVVWWCMIEEHPFTRYFCC